MRRYKSRLEADYASYLELLRLGREIHWWDYEAWTFVLADGTRYTPDFPVILPSGLIELHETKGHMREAARIRLNVAARQYPWFTWKLIRKPGGQWQSEIVAP